MIPMVEVLGGKWMLTKQAAVVLQVSRQRVHQLVKCGVLGSVVWDGVLLVRAETVEARRKSRRGVDGS